MRVFKYNIGFRNNCSITFTSMLNYNISSRDIATGYAFLGDVMINLKEVNYIQKEIIAEEETKC